MLLANDASGFTDITGTLTAMVAGLSGLAPIVYQLWKKISIQEKRLTLFWKSRLMRGLVEAQAKNLLSASIPNDLSTERDPDEPYVSPNAKVYSLYTPIIDKLLELKKKNLDSDYIEMAELIEDKFGPWIVSNICSVLGVTEFACLVIALSIANGNKPLPVLSTTTSQSSNIQNPSAPIM